MGSLKSFIIGASIIVSIAGYFIFFTAGNYFFEKIAIKKGVEISETISKQTFNSMYQVMKKGWSRDELNEFVDSTNSAFRDSSLSISIYRSKIVDELFGEIEKKSEQSLEVKEALKDGKIRSEIGENSVRFIYPIKTTLECKKCHINTNSGDILGVIETKQNLKDILSEARGDFNLFLLVMTPIPIIVALLVAMFLARKVDRSIRYFHKGIESINSVTDLKKFEFSEQKFGFTELDRIYKEVGTLTSRLKDIAADKELLEFEVKLLDKFIIATDIVQDWKEHIKSLIKEINQIMEVYSLFVIFQVEEESYDLEIFWIAEPSEKTKDIFEESVKGRIKENPYFSDITQIVIHHHITNSDESLKELTMENIELQTKSLIMAAPKIGGVVGIGVQSSLSEDETRFIVIESILTTLINVIGSVKAIYKYTKDLEYYATRDPLTNLFNQRVFMELLHYEIGRAKRRGYKFSVLMFDFDNFKYINDQFGHAFGDKFLQSYSLEARATLRGDDILARYGGDEFVAILPDTDTEQAYMIGKKIRDRMEAISIEAPNGEKVKATVSIGISVYPDHGKDDKELFLIADNMMYKSKRAGKNRISSPNEDDIAQSFKIAGEKTQLVLNTLEKRNLVPYFQPIQNIASGGIEIYELLMRIQTDSDIITASEFIDVAESLGVIHKLDYILIEKAFEVIMEREYKGMLFINISPKALIIGEFIKNILTIAKKYKINTENIVLEITERDTVKNVTLLEKFVQELKFEGFKFAVDDFGSGFSSFHYVKRLPIDYIKIEGEFIRTLQKDSADIALIKSIVTLAKELKIKTVAEYVESAEILEEVRKVGVDYAQGYYIGKPKEDFLQEETTL